MPPSMAGMTTLLPNMPSYNMGGIMSQPQHPQQQPQQPEQSPEMQALMKQLLMGKMSGVGIAAPAPTVDKKDAYNIVDMKRPAKKLVFAELNPDAYEELRRDFEVVASMNLLDDDNIMNTLLLNTPGMLDNRLYCFGAMVTAYKHKYEELVRKYPSVGSYIEFVLGLYILHENGTLDSLIDRKMYKTPDNTMPSMFAFSVRKKRKVTRTDENELSSSSVNSKCMRTSTDDGSNNATDSYSVYEVLNESEKLKYHPFHSLLSHFKGLKMFELGKFTDTCVPSDFSVLFASGQFGPLNVFDKHGDKDNRKTKIGLKVNYSKPIVCMSTYRFVGPLRYIMYHIRHLDSLSDALLAALDMSVATDGHRLGQKHEEDWFKINDKTRHKTPYNMEKDERDDHVFSLVWSTLVYAQENDDLQTKSFTNTMVIMDDKLKIPQNIVNACESLNDETRIDYIKMILEWEKMYYPGQELSFNLEKETKLLENKRQRELKFQQQNEHMSSVKSRQMDQNLKGPKHQMASSHMNGELAVPPGDNSPYHMMNSQQQQQQRQFQQYQMYMQQQQQHGNQGGMPAFIAPQMNMPGNGMPMYYPQQHQSQRGANPAIMPSMNNESNVAGAESSLGKPEATKMTGQTGGGNSAAFSMKNVANTAVIEELPADSEQVKGAGIGGGNSNGPSSEGGEQFDENSMDGGNNVDGADPEKNQDDENSSNSD